MSFTSFAFLSASNGSTVGCEVVSCLSEDLSSDFWMSFQITSHHSLILMYEDVLSSVI